MRMKILAALVGVVAAVGAVSWNVAPVAMKAADATPAMTSIGPLTFGPDGVLFAADTQAAAIFALDLGTGAASGAPGAQGDRRRSIRRSPRCSAPTRARSRSPIWRCIHARATPTSR